MLTTKRPLLLALELTLCCLLCSATSRTLSPEEPAATSDAVATAAAVPQSPRCSRYPPPPPGIRMSNWTARWPQACMKTPINGFCDATCLKGYTPWPHRPRIYCRANAAGTANWALPIEGKCVPFCRGTPPYLSGVSWPSACKNVPVEGTTPELPVHPSTCVGNCSRGYLGEPQPVAKCMPATGSGPAQWHIVERACRDNACDGLPGNITWPSRGTLHQAGRWPQNCSGLEVGSACEGICSKGFAADPVPIATCVPPNGTYPYAKWAINPKGACRDDVCDGIDPVFAFYGRWPYNCSMSVGSSCTAVCDEGFVGEPSPVAVCTKPKENETGAAWVYTFFDGCKDATACRDDPCHDIAFAVVGSCIATFGEPSTPGSGQFSCSCFDYHNWDATTKACTPASLLAFAVTQPVGSAQRRQTAGQVPEASWIYIYGAEQAADIGNASWIAQDNGTSAANLYDVAVADASTAWAVGSQGIIKRYDGNKWAEERPPTAGASTLHAVAALGGKTSLKAWAGGANGFALYYDGSSWVDVSVNAGQQINDIAAVVEPGGVETVWAVAGDERNPSKFMGYIYKWDAQAGSWGIPSEVTNVTLRSVTALDRYRAWAVGFHQLAFNKRGDAISRSIAMAWNYSSQVWTGSGLMVPTLDALYFNIDGFIRLNSVTALKDGSLFVAGHVEKADTSGTVSMGFFGGLQCDMLLRCSLSVMEAGGGVARFNAVAGLSLNTTVAVGSFTDEVADRPADSSLDWGYPAVVWLKHPLIMPQDPNGSIAYDQEVVGVGMQYVQV